MDIKEYLDAYITRHSAELNLSVHTIKNKTNIFERLIVYSNTQ